MKKARIIRAIKKADTDMIKKYNMVSFSDEKGKTYVLGTKEGFDIKINEAVNFTIHKVLEKIDDETIRDKFLNSIKDEQNKK